MRRTLVLTAIGLLAASPAMAGQGATKKKGEKPAASPGWVIVEEDYFYPLRFEADEVFHDAQMHFRRGEEKAAANEITRAASWLNFAAGHGYPETQKDLKAAATELTSLAKDLRAGNLVAASRIDSVLARSAHALATWHYFMAQQSLAKDEMTFAAQDLQAASVYLQSAAKSAHLEYGAGAVAMFEDVDRDGRAVDEGVTIEPNRVQSHLDAIKAELNKMSATLKKDAA